MTSRSPLTAPPLIAVGRADCFDDRGSPMVCLAAFRPYHPHPAPSMDNSETSSIPARLARLEEHMADVERRSNDGSRSAAVRLDASCAAFELRQMARRLRDSAGVPTAERLFAAADNLAEWRRGESPFTTMLRRDATFLANLTDGLCSSVENPELSAGELTDAWQRGFERAIELVRQRLLAGPTIS